MDKLAALALMQEHHLAWETGNFGPQPIWVPLNGVVEEAGELFRSYLKIFQGIRGDVSKHKHDAKDAVGDILVFTLSYCTKMGLKMADILKERGPFSSAPVDEVWTPHQDGLFAIQKAVYRLVEAHIEGLDIEEVKARVYGLMVALQVFSDKFLDGTHALDHMFMAWDEVKRREWKVNPWNGTTEKCNVVLREAGKAYPRTCALCGLGPCRNTPKAPEPSTKCCKCGADCGFAMVGNICKGCSVDASPSPAPKTEAMTKCLVCGTDVGFTSPCPRCRHTPDAPYPNGKDGKGGGMVLDPTLNPGE